MGVGSVFLKLGCSFGALAVFLLFLLGVSKVIVISLDFLKGLFNNNFLGIELSKDSYELHTRYIYAFTLLLSFLIATVRYWIYLEAKNRHNREVQRKINDKLSGLIKARSQKEN